MSLSIDNRLEDIRRRFAASAEITRDDAAYLLSRIEKLEEKNKALAQHALELTQEIENVKTDFDPNFR